MKFTLIGEDYVNGDKTTVEFTAADINIVLSKMKEFLLGCGYECRPGNLDFVDKQILDTHLHFGYNGTMAGDFPPSLSETINLGNYGAGQPVHSFYNTDEIRLSWSDDLTFKMHK